MSEFRTSFNLILSRDIKHIYSGIPQPFTYRHSSPYPSKEQLLKQGQNKDYEAYVEKSSEFVPEYSCSIPRAPAFRILSRHDINNLVFRLSQPTVASQGLANTSDRNMLAEKQRTKSQFLGLRSVDQRELTMINKRINRPTATSLRREFHSRRHVTAA